MKVDAVLFDLFDTLLLLQDQKVYYPPSLKKLYEFLSDNGISIPFDDFKHAYFEVRDKFYSESRKSLNEPHFNVRVSQTLRKFGHNFDISDPIVVGATAAFAEEFMHYVTLDKEALSVLQKLHGKYKLGLISNFAIPECCWNLLERFKLRNYFDIVLISGDIDKRKPGAEIFEKALKALGTKAAKAVFVGDMLDLDVVGPKKVGMKTILIQRRPIGKDVDTRPDKIITHLSELLDMLEDC
jgi:putative hydrolase of the HAD superfamily